MRFFVPWSVFIAVYFFYALIIGVFWTYVIYALIVLAPIIFVGWAAWCIRENNRDWKERKKELGID